MGESNWWSQLLNGFGGGPRPRSVRELLAALESGPRAGRRDALEELVANEGAHRHQIEPGLCRALLKPQPEAIWNAMLAELARRATRDNSVMDGRAPLSLDSFPVLRDILYDRRAPAKARLQAVRALKLLKCLGRIPALAALNPETAPDAVLARLDILCSEREALIRAAEEERKVNQAKSKAKAEQERLEKLRNSGRCPYCGSTHVVYSSTRDGFTDVLEQITRECRDCGRPV